MPVKRKPVLVTLDDEQADKPGGVIARLKKAGLTKLKHLESIGIVSGEAPASKIEAIRKVPGVRAVEEDAPIQLPPPDAPVQ